MQLPHVSPPQWPDVPSGRFAAHIHSASPVACRICILGLPDDLGVRLNHGRPGAAQGPAAFRAALARFGADFDAITGKDLSVGVFDAGDVIPAHGNSEAALHETHQRVTDTVRTIHASGMVTLCIGGGHDLTFASVRGASLHAGTPLGGINVDAHLDVRETVGSGMPYRALIEGGFADPVRFVEFGIGRFANSRAHTQWLVERGATIAHLDHVLEDFTSVFESTSLLAVAGNDPSFVSIDLDAIDGSQAPGVSALNPMGLEALHAAEIAQLAGASPGVRHFDIMELCPPHDTEGRTARLAALLALQFVAGFGERGE